MILGWSTGGKASDWLPASDRPTFLPAFDPDCVWGFRDDAAGGEQGKAIADEFARWPEDFPEGKPPAFGAKRNKGPLRIDYSPPMFLADHDFHVWRGSRCDCAQMAEAIAKELAAC